MNHAVKNKPPRFLASRWQTVLIVFMLALGVNGQANAALSDGLVAYWSFDDCTANDKSGKGNNGTINGNPQCVNGVKGKAFQFDGIDDYIEVANSDTLNLTKLSISAWVDLNSFSQSGGTHIHHMIVNKEAQYEVAVMGQAIDDAQQQGIAFAFNPYWYWYGANNSESATSLLHVVLSFDSNNLATVYINGKKSRTVQYSYPIQTTSNCLRIGARGCGYPDINAFFNGSIDELRIYNRALTDAEVTALYQQGTTPCTKVANNPCYQEIKAEIAAIAKEKNIPPVVIQSIAFKESGWLHFDTQQYTLDYCVADVGLPLVKYSRACEKDGRVGIGMMQVTVFPDDSNFNQLSSDWKYNLRAGVDKLWSKWQTQRTEAPNDTGFDIDPTVIEAWYYPVMWYNGENARAWDYVKSAFQYMSAEPPLNLSNVWDKVTGIKNPQGILDMPNKETYHVKDLALKSVPIHQWNPTTGKYADITSQVLNGETPTAVPTVVKDNWTPFADGFDMPFSGSPAQSQNYLDFLGVYGGTTYDGYHPGEDWKVPFNGSVFSIANGKVERVGSSTGLGYYLVIRHQLAGNSDSFYSVFYHLKKPLVSKGEKVYRGQKVAVIGDFDVPVHLHFELRNFLPTNLYANDNAHSLGYYGHGVWDANSKDYYGTDDLKLAAEKIMLKDGFFIAPATFVSENAPSSVSSDVSALMRTYQNAGLINKTLNQYFVEKRGQFIAILIRALEKRANQTLTEAADLPYADVPLNSGIRSSLLKACQLKILSACAGGTQTKFNPDMPITRQEALAFTIRAYEALKQPIVFDSTKANTFVDVPESNTFNQTVVKGYQVGLTSGVVDGTYRYFYPARWVQRGEAVSFVEKLVIQLNAK